MDFGDLTIHGLIDTGALSMRIISEAELQQIKQIAPEDILKQGPYQIFKSRWPTNN